MPLLGKAEKVQLEELVLARLTAHYDLHGPAALLADGVRLVVTSAGAAIDHGETADPLAAVPLRGLFTALCYLAADASAMPREALASLAIEATTAAATQVNRFSPD